MFSEGAAKFWNLREVTMPKDIPAPRRAQKRSEFSDSEAQITSPVAVTSSASISESRRSPAL